MTDERPSIVLTLFALIERPERTARVGDQGSECTLDFRQLLLMRTAFVSLVVSSVPKPSGKARRVGLPQGNGQLQGKITISCDHLVIHWTHNAKSARPLNFRPY